MNTEEDTVEDYYKLHDPSKALCERLRDLAFQAAYELDNDACGGEASPRWVREAADSYYDALYDAITELEIPSPRSLAEDARVQDAVSRMTARTGL